MCKKSIPIMKSAFIGVITVLALLAGSTQSVMGDHQPNHGDGPQGQLLPFPFGPADPATRECIAKDPGSTRQIRVVFGPAITGVDPATGYPTGFATGENPDGQPRTRLCNFDDPGTTVDERTVDCAYWDVLLTLENGLPDEDISKFFLAVSADLKIMASTGVIQERIQEDATGTVTEGFILKDIDNSIQTFLWNKFTDPDFTTESLPVGQMAGTVVTTLAQPTRTMVTGNIKTTSPGKDSVIKVSCAGEGPGSEFVPWLGTFTANECAEVPSPEPVSGQDPINNVQGLLFVNFIFDGCAVDYEQSTLHANDPSCGNAPGAPPNLGTLAGLGGVNILDVGALTLTAQQEGCRGVITFGNSPLQTYLTTTTSETIPICRDAEDPQPAGCCYDGVNNFPAGCTPGPPCQTFYCGNTPVGNCNATTYFCDSEPDGGLGSL